MNYPAGLAPQDGDLLQQRRCTDYLIEVRQRDNCRWMHFGDGSIQAMLDLSDPCTPMVPYNQVMLLALAMQAAPKRLLNLGAGGNSFERLLAARLAGLQVTSVEADSNVIELAKQFFPAPADHPIHCATAEAFLAQAAQPSYDQVFCDLYGAGRHPACLVDPAFYTQLAARVSATGIVTLNLLPESEQAVVELLLALRTSFAWVALLDLPEYKNILVFAGKQPLADSGQLSHRCKALEQQLLLPLQPLAAKLRRLPPPGGGGQV